MLADIPYMDPFVPWDFMKNQTNATATGKILNKCSRMQQDLPAENSQ
jgi:hypothetical protein